MVGLSDITGSINTAKALATEDPNNLGNFNKALQKGVQNFCQAYGNNEAVFNLSFLGPAASEICAPYFNQQGQAQPSSKQEYTGGQCAVQYLVKTSGRQKNGLGVWTDVEAAVTGPLGGLAFYKEPQGYGVYITNGAGNLQAISPYTSGFNELELTAGPTVRRADGQPDNCGDPPKVFTPTGGPTYNFGDTSVVNNNDGSTTNVTVGLPSVDLKGNLNVPVDVGGVSVNLGGSSEASPSGSDPVQSQPPVSPGDLAENGGDFPPPPDGQKYIGAAWRLTAIQPGQPPIPDTLLNQVLPVIAGNFALKVSSDTGLDFASQNVLIKAERGYIKEENSGLTVKGVYVNVRDGYEVEVIPLTVSTGE